MIHFNLSFLRACDAVNTVTTLWVSFATPFLLYENSLGMPVLLYHNEFFNCKNQEKLLFLLKTSTSQPDSPNPECEAWRQPCEA